MSGFRAIVAEAARRRLLQRRRPPLDELEEAAARWRAVRRPLEAALRRPGERAAGGLPGAPPPRWIGTLAALDPASGKAPARIDWPAWIGSGHDLGLHAFLVQLEADFHGGSGAPIEDLHGGSDRPLLVDDPIVEPLQVLELLSRPVDAIILDPAYLGADSMNEALALLQAFGAAAIVVVRTIGDVEGIAREAPAAVFIDRLDSDSLEPVAGRADRLLAALDGIPALRLLGGAIRNAAAAEAAALRAVDAVVLDPGWLWSPDRRKETARLPGLAVRGETRGPNAAGTSP